MSSFPRIPPEHPLTEAARYVNAYSEEHGMDETLEWLEMNVTAGELAYLAEQRAYRAVAAMMGINLSGSGAEEIVRKIIKTPLWRNISTLLIACYMDGIAIGWKGHEIK